MSVAFTTTVNVTVMAVTTHIYYSAVNLSDSEKQLSHYNRLNIMQSS